jgi:hypothetical protein
MEGEGDGERDGDGKGDGDWEGDVEIGRQRYLREWRQRDNRKNERTLLLRQYIDATMHLAPIGNAVRICCVINF